MVFTHRHEPPKYARLLSHQDPIIPKKCQKFLDLSLVTKVNGVYSELTYVLHQCFVGICSVVFV